MQRGAGQFAVDVTLAKLNVPAKSIASSTGSRPFFRGMRADYSSLVAQQPPRRREIPKGVLISEVQPDTTADRAKLRVGDVITQVNRKPVTTLGEARENKGQPGDAVQLKIIRNGQTRFLVIKN